MSFIKKISLSVLLINIVLFTFSCTDGGVQTGSSMSSFSGVGAVTVLSPTSVKISWTKSSTVKEYLIFQNSSTAPIGRTALDYYIVEGLTPETPYSFKVIGDTSTNLFGSDKEEMVTTWSRFTGITSAQAKSLTSVELTWNYPNPAQKYLIFYRKDAAPDATSTSNWTVSKAETATNKILISGLDSSSKYYFMVQAVYRETEKEITNKSISISTKTSFAVPTYSISSVSIGSVPTVLIDPVEDATHGENFFKTTVLWNGIPISDPLVGKGQIVISASANLPLGKVDNISLKVDYADGNKTESMTIDGIVTFIKGMPTNKEIPPITSLSLGSSYMGQVLTRGDFNCDGQDDLAVGLPAIAIASAGVKNTYAGAVIVYYSKQDPNDPTKLILNTSGTPSTNPALGDPLLITFDDLASNARFGTSLSSGNFNGDKNGNNPCDDLLVGAPGEIAQQVFRGAGSTTVQSSVRTGAAFLFFGSTKGLSTAGHVSDIAINASTCNGSLSNAICGPVKLFENQYDIPTGLTGGSQLVKSASAGSQDNFGQALSFVGDFNGDGYEDVVIGAPGAAFDGRLTNLNTSTKTIDRTGAIYVFFGSKFGLGYEYPDASGVPSVTNPKVRYIKAYAPIPQGGAQFGAAIAGGADIDGRFKIRANNGANYYGGGDFVVGSPGFRYENYLTSNNLALSPDYFVGTDPNTTSILASPNANNWWDVGTSLSSPTNYYGFAQDSNVNVGAAFIYFGRGSVSAPTADETPSRAQFWKCGKRGIASGNEHFSCLYDNTNVRMLTPRLASSVSAVTGFGSAVAVMGPKSRYTENTTAVIPSSEFSDPNKDGFADVVVSAPNATVSGKLSVGILQVYYGNPSRFFNPADFFNVMGSGGAVADTGSNEVTCTDFSDISSGMKKLCKPVILSSASLGAGARIGGSPSQLAVGDVSGDGVKDLAVGAPGDNVVGAGSGAALVYSGIASGGLSPTYKKIYTTSAGAYENLGTSVVIGNFNGDKNGNYPYGDLFAGAPYDSVNRPGGGAVYGFYTQNTSLASTLSTHNVLITENLASFTDYGLGETRLVGDINNDGYTDAISKITTYQADGSKAVDVVVYFGSSIGLITTSFCQANKALIFKTANSGADCYPNVSPAQGITLNSIALPQKIRRPSNMDGMWAFMGIEAGDVNHDGFGDVLFIPANNCTTCYSTLFFGSRTGLLNVVDPSWQPAAGDPQIVSQIIKVQVPPGGDEFAPGASNNRSPFVVADFNGDGFYDLAVGLPQDSSRNMNKSLSTYTDQDTGVGLTGSSVLSQNTGWNCTNGSGNNDCKTGKFVEQSGSIRILYGSTMGYQTPQRIGLVGDLYRTNIFNIAGSEAGATKPCDSSSLTTQEPNCKASYMDNPVFENIDYGFEKLGHNFGSSIAAVDVNNDGYPDLLVSSPGYEDLSCYSNSTNPVNYGRVYVFYGGEYGLTAATPRSYYEPNLSLACPVAFADDKALKLDNGGKVRAIMPTLVDAANNLSRQFGTTLTSVGDVNNDGFEDFIVADPSETVGGVSGAGAIYVYYGPLCPADNYDLITDEFQQAGNLNLQKFYMGQAPAGLAAGQESNISITDTSLKNSCFRGASSKMKPMPQKIFILSAKQGESWGMSVLAGKKKKGDFNRDGYDDVIIGSPYYSDTVTSRLNLGQGVVLFGSALGLYAGDFPTTSVISTASGQLRPYSIIPTQYTSGSQFFKKMLCTGDINGDGTMDLLIPSQEYSGEGAYQGVNIGTFLIFN